MTDSRTSKEQFRCIDPLKRPEFHARNCHGNPRGIIIQGGRAWSAFGLTVDEARQLRDWLTSALPADEPGALRTIPGMTTDDDLTKLAGSYTFGGTVGHAQHLIFRHRDVLAMLRQVIERAQRFERTSEPPSSCYQLIDEAIQRVAAAPSDTPAAYLVVVRGNGQRHEFAALPLTEPLVDGTVGGPDVGLDPGQEIVSAVPLFRRAEQPPAATQEEGAIQESTRDEQAGLLNAIETVWFRAGLLACRAYMAAFVEQGGDKNVADSIRANWWPSLGDDPGQPRQNTFQELTIGEYGEPGFRVKTREEVSPSTEALPVALLFLQGHCGWPQVHRCASETKERSL